MRELEIMERSHHINTRLNRWFSAPLFLMAWFITVVLFFSPYWLRTLIAFKINFLFNRPKIYHFYFFEKLGKKINKIVLAIFYFTIFGIYAVFYRMGSRRSHDQSTWVESVGELKLESHHFQS